MTEKIDLNKTYKAEYAAPKKPVLLDIPAATYLSITGKGAPGGAEFEKRIGALYAMAYTVKMTRKFVGLQDYTIGKLESQWWAENDAACFSSLPKEQWCWKLLIRTPDFVEELELKKAVAVLLKREKPAEVAEVKLETFTEGRCVQMLHVGPYEQEGDTASIMLSFAKAEGFASRGRHHDIYISDPRRVAPEKLKTILRQPVEKGVSVKKIESIGYSKRSINSTN
jgi:hypothetical protein